jgi:hypothetical protein
MNRRLFAGAVALAALVFSVDSAFAGSPSTQTVRIKNVGAAPVAVFAANGSPTESQVAAGYKLISPNGVAQFVIRQGAGIGVAVDPTATAAMMKKKAVVKNSLPTAILPFTFPKSRFVYLVATAGGASPTINFAAPGTRF